MTNALATTDRLGVLQHLVDRYSTAEQAAGYVIEGATDTEIRVTFTSEAKTVTGVGKTLDEAAADARAQMVAETPEPEAETPKPKGSRPKAAPVITRSNTGA